MKVLDLGLRDNVKARELQPNGAYVRARRRPGQRRLDSQAHLIARSRRKG
jgi:polyphosphate kinase